MTKKHKITFVEKTISFVIIIILFIISIVILLKQSSYDIKNFGMISPGATGTGPNIDLAIISLKKFTPNNFELYLNNEVYNSENLHIKINGKATLYTDNGFVKMVSQRFAAKNDKKLWFEVFIYDMSSSRNSYSVFSQQRRADANIIKTMKMAYSTENALFISIGNYYIEILGAFQSNMMNKAMMQTGQKIESFFKTSEEKNISELSLFDKKLTVAGSENLYPNDAFGYHGLYNIFTAKYKLDKKLTTVFISKKNDENSARKEAMNYIKFLLENGGTKVKSAVKDVVFIDLFGSYESIFTHNEFLLGVHGADNQKIAEKVTTELYNKIKKENP